MKFKMKLISILLINLFLMMSSIRNENNFSKAWQSICKINSCEPTLQECINDGCFGKVNCKSCVEDYHTTCGRCVDDIYDEAAQITLPDNRKTIICDINNQLHITVCNFFCRSLFKLNYKCEIISDMPVCNCMDTTATSTTTTTTTFPTTLTTTTKNPNNPSNLLLKLRKLRSEIRNLI